MNQPSHFVLVHGAWHASWCWMKIVPLLREAGHLVTTVDLPGRWHDPNNPPTLTAEDNIHAVGQVLKTSPVPVILVGHSMGGATISLVAERYPELIRRLVYLSAFLIPSGKTVKEITLADEETILHGAKSGPTIVAEKARDVFYGRCSDDDVRIAQQLLSPETLALFSHPIVTTPERFGVVPRVYIECLQDRAVGLKNQRAMQSAVPCEQVLALDTDHSPFFSEPDELARMLGRLSA